MPTENTAKIWGIAIFFRATEEFRGTVCRRKEVVCFGVVPLRKFDDYFSTRSSLLWLSPCQKYGLGVAVSFGAWSCEVGLVRKSDNMVSNWKLSNEGEEPLGV